MKLEHRQREYNLDHALVLAIESLKNHNMNFTLETKDKAGELYTYLCLLNNHNLKLTFRGAGSGLKQEARVKAIYEAMEDSLLYEIFSLGDEQLISMLSTKSSPSTAFLQKNELLPAILTQENYLKNDYPWLKLNKLHHQGKTIYYPLGLLFPHTGHIDKFNKYVSQNDISQIANTTGIAMGATEAEALIHGINDWIERDAYGLFLLTTLVKKTKPARCLIKQSLPDNIRSDIEVIETIYADELMVIDITTNFNIPAFFVSFTKQAVPVQPSGLGASLCKVDALQQALFEALQARDRYNSNTVAARLKTIRYYQQYPALLRAFNCDLMQLSKEGCSIDIAWDDVITHQINMELNKQIDLMMAQLNRLGIEVYSNILFQDSNGLTLTYVLLVGVETFGMMREGIFTRIKNRGLEILA